MTSSDPQPFEHSANWRDQQLLTRDDWMISIDDAERIQQVQQNLEHGSGAALIRGYDSSGKSDEENRQFFLEFASRIGTPISQSAGGDLIFSVRDEGFGEKDPRTRGPNTSKKLSFHTDRCDVIAFLCLSQAREGGENEIVSSIAVYNEILKRRPDLLQQLLEPYYYKRHNVDTGNDLPYCQQPIFSFHEGHFASAFLRVLIERAYAMNDLPDMTVAQREALDFVEAVAAEPEMHAAFHQEPGDILLLNNWVTYHRRTAFVDYDDPALKRHILRIWLSVPNSRPLAPWFKDNYGATEAGAIRGGMRATAPTNS